MILKKIKIFTQTRVIAATLLIVILLGAGLLTLPVASVAGTVTPFFTALFTAFSATTTTGLTVVDTGAYYSLFGQVVILFMMQIGGLGFLTFLGFFMLTFRGKMSLHECNLMMQAAGVVRRDSISRLIKRILSVTAIVEGFGAALLSIRFIPMLGFGKGLFYAFFHTVSAFSNSGMDLGGAIGSASLSRFAGDPLVLLTVAFVGLAGGLGFLAWDDFIVNGIHVRRYSLSSKIAVITTGVVVPCAFFLTLATEWQAALAGMSVPQKLLCGFFNAVTPLTSGFYAVSPASYSQGGLALIHVLMLIGGSPGSTAGGIKTTTIAVLILSSLTLARHHSDVEAHKRRISNGSVMLAGAVFFYFIVMSAVSTVLIAAIEPDTVPLSAVMTDVISAITTDGLSVGITPSLLPLSKLILMFLMLIGRIGGIAFLYMLSEGKKRNTALQRPTEDILVG